MSYFDDASLVMIPSGYKDQKVYSVKPTDGTGDLTFTRSNDTATRVNSAGLIEKVRTNLVLQSEAFNTTWAVNGIVVTANTAANPLTGATNADTITADAANNFHLIGQSITYAAGEATVSVYVKANGYTWFVIDPSITNAFGYYNITTGVVGTKGSACTTSITNVGGGWYRCSVTFTATAGAAVLNFSIRNADNGGAFLGDGVSGFFIYGAQVEMGVATDYIATTSAAVSVGPVANVPRLDYLNSSCPRLLLEPQRTNVVLFSESIDNAAWTKDGSTATANQTASPSGYVDADLITNNGGAADHSVYQQYALSASTAYSVSAYVKKGTEQYVFFALNYGANANEWATATFNLDAGTSGNYSNILSAPTSTITSVGNDWYRVTMTATTATSGTHILIIGFGKAGAPDTSRGRYIANNTNTFYLWGCQLEQGSYATSYIPTLGAAVTRGADFAKKENIAGTLPTAYPFTLFGESDFYLGSDDFALSFIDITTTNTYYTIGTYANKYIAVARSSAGEIVATSSVDYTAGMNKVAAVFTSNSIKVFANGALVATATNTLSFTSSVNDLIVGTLRESADLGTRNSAKQILVFPSALSDSEAIALTA